MALAAVRGRLTWAPALVVASTREGARAVRLALDVPDWPGHLPGQHLDVRLTAPDGYTAQRSYSIASAPEQPRVELVVQPLPDGEVSGYLAGELRAGDTLEVRGPVGRWFVWHTGLGGPVQLVAGGSGVAPFLAMVEHHTRSVSEVPVRLLRAARSAEDLLGTAVLERAGPAVVRTDVLSRTWPTGWSGPTGRVDAAVLRGAAFPPSASPLTYVCGPNGFVDTVTGALEELGHPLSTVKTERFGG